MTDVFYDCLFCDQAGRTKQQEAELMFIRIKSDGLEFDLVCKKCNGIKRAKMAEGGQFSKPLQYKPQSFEDKMKIT